MLPASKNFIRVGLLQSKIYVETHLEVKKPRKSYYDIYMSIPGAMRKLYGGVAECLGQEISHWLPLEHSFEVMFWWDTLV